MEGSIWLGFAQSKGNVLAEMTGIRPLSVFG
jgi:hypothetical protein